MVPGDEKERGGEKMQERNLHLCMKERHTWGENNARKYKIKTIPFPNTHSAV